MLGVLLGLLAAGPDFGREVGPLLETQCLRCHNDNVRKGGLSLATAGGLADALMVEPGNADASRLIDVVTPHGDAPPEMPHEGRPLTAAEVDLLRRWVDAGAAWPEGVTLREPSAAGRDWWSLRPLSDAGPPEVTDPPDGWAANPVDAFVLAKLREAGLSPNGPASRRDLIRRATFDLHGLPPTPQEITAFLADDSPDAYRNLVERLLASPRYGERWGRHWLDVVRFGESIGFERNVIVDNAWPFRDYVIRAFNEDRPFDAVIREHLAGDVIAAGEPGREVGSAFLTVGPYDDVGNQDPAAAARIRANTIDDMVRATGEAFLGLSLGCARCHDHKFDAIQQADYYRVAAAFKGVRHGSRPLATPEFLAERAAKLKPLQKRKRAIQAEIDAALAAVRERADGLAAELEAAWTRPPVDRTGTVETFEPTPAKFVRLICDATDRSADAWAGFKIAEFEVWTAGEAPRNAALGGTASGTSRRIEDFDGAYDASHAIDGDPKTRFIAAGKTLTVELPEVAMVDRVVFSSTPPVENLDHPFFQFVGEYRIQVSGDGDVWREVASGADRRPPHESIRRRRLEDAARTAEDGAALARLRAEMRRVDAEIAAVPAPPNVWVGRHSAADAKGPFPIALGGDPTRPGPTVTPASLSTLSEVTAGFELPEDAPHTDRRRRLAEWVTQADNPLTPRVLANRVWQHHFGRGLVATPNDFGAMGAEPSHPALLDFLARRLQADGWRLKPLHRLVMLSAAYRQSADHRAVAAAVDADARLLWRFPPRRLSAEEVRDAVLSVAGVLRHDGGGPGFRLYRYTQDNVATYFPLDRPGPETYRRAVYHQTARASRTDVLSDFDQPDCAFSSGRRTRTTTPLQALTMLNSAFTLDMAEAMATRLRSEAEMPDEQVRRAFALAYGRDPTPDETAACVTVVSAHGLRAFCRAVLNTSELISVR